MPLSIHALPVVGAIACLEVVTCAAITPNTTRTAIIRHGELVRTSTTPSAREVGTSVTVSDIFATRPVARKQLAKPGAAAQEAEHVRCRLAAVSLAQPSVSIRLFDANRRQTLLRLQRSSNVLGSLRQMIGGGLEMLPSLVPFRVDDEAYHHEVGSTDARSFRGFSLEGYACVPPASFRTRECQHLFLNRRPLSRRSELHKLIVESFCRVRAGLAGSGGGRSTQGHRMASSGSQAAYHEHERRPATGAGPASAAPPPSQSAHAAFVLFLSCPAHRFDVTLEPDKSEALFDDGGVDAGAFVLDALCRLFVTHCCAPPSDASHSSQLPPPPHQQHQPELHQHRQQQQQRSERRPTSTTLSAAAIQRLLEPLDPRGTAAMRSASSSASAAAVGRRRLRGGGSGPNDDLGGTVGGVRRADEHIDARADEGAGRRTARRLSTAGIASRVPTALVSKPALHGQTAVSTSASAIEPIFAAADSANAATASSGGRDGDRSTAPVEVVDSSHTVRGESGGLFDTSMITGIIMGGESGGSRPRRGARGSAWGRRGPLTRPPGAGVGRELLSGSSGSGGSGGSVCGTSGVLSTGGQVVTRESLGGLHALGQLERKFIIAVGREVDGGQARMRDVAARREREDGRGILYAVDQHAADERIKLEELQRATIDATSGLPAAGGIERRRLRLARQLSLSAHERAAVTAYAERLRAWGWELREGEGQGGGGGGSGGGGSSFMATVTHGEILLESVPAVQSVELGEPAMLEFACALAATAGGSRLAPPAVQRVLASKACRRAVMFGTELSNDQCEHILARLAECDLPFQCAHGRPSIIPLLDLAELPLPDAGIADHGEM